MAHAAGKTACWGRKVVPDAGKQRQQRAAHKAQQRGRGAQRQPERAAYAAPQPDAGVFRLCAHAVEQLAHCIVGGTQGRFTALGGQRGLVLAPLHAHHKLLRHADGSAGLFGRALLCCGGRLCCNRRGVRLRGRVQGFVRFHPVSPCSGGLSGKVQPAAAVEKLVLFSTMSPCLQARESRWKK